MSSSETDTQQSAAAPSPFPPIAEYAFLSNCHTGALVAPDGCWRATAEEIKSDILERGARVHGVTRARAPSGEQIEIEPGGACAGSQGIRSG